MVHVWGRPHVAAACLTVLVALSVCIVPAQAQLGGLGKKIKQKASERIERKTDEAAETVVDKADPTSRDKATEPGGSAKASTASRQVAANFDFVPGQRTLYYTDFSDDRVGNFPRRLRFTTGSMEVVEIDGVRALKASSPSGFIIPLTEALPDRFTVEIDVINRNSRGVGAATLKLYGGTETRTDRDRERTRVTYGPMGWDVSGGGTETAADFTSNEADQLVGQKVRFRVLGDGAYLKVYADGRRLANIPNANFLRDKGLFIALEARDADDNAVYVTQVRVAESQTSIYDALSESGRWATQGILFETGKADIRPESAPTLREIARTLGEHSDLRIRIEGHTDNVGNAASNTALSAARASAVRDALVGEHGVAAGRLETAGFGDTKPVQPNTTPEGRSGNRRVEIVKI